MGDGASQTNSSTHCIHTIIGPRHRLDKRSECECTLLQALHAPEAYVDTYSTGIEGILKYRFKRRSLLQEALTHTSWPDATQRVCLC